MVRVSIIIVHYKVKRELLACLQSIIASKPKSYYEIIVVDNDERKTIEKELHKKFPNVMCVPNENRGFGEGCNVGAKAARGEYLFFLNPDTEVHPGAIDHLISFLQKKKDAGIVAPLLLGTDGKAYQQGTLELTPKRGIFALSFLNKLFPNNPTAKQYFLSDWDRKSTKEVDVAPGTAFMLRKDLFEKVGGFDEKFFLFFEEFDFCKRVKDLGYKLFIYPKARVLHAWGVSTKQRSDIDTIFAKSRFYYFKKHFGLLPALFTEAVLRFSKYTALLVMILLAGLFLRIYNLQESMPFIGDQGWYYLSARDMVLTGDIPLVGIASSHPWLHQGALWTYLLAGGFWLFSFSPFTGAYLSIGLGVLAIWGMYWLGSAMFSRNVGIIAAALSATSPLVIVSDRMPYHTSPIPLVTILFIYCLFKWVSGNVRFFPLVIASLGLLYNLEIATVLLGMTTMVIWLYGYMVKKFWARKVLSSKFLVLSVIAYAITMLSMLIYDFGHGFPQTLGFVAWLGYKVLLMFGFPPINPGTPVAWSEMVAFSVDQLKQLIFPYSWWLAVGVFVGSFAWLVWHIRQNRFGAIFKIAPAGVLLLFLNIVLLVGFFAARTPSDAYLPMMFPGLLLLIAAASSYKVIRLSGYKVLILILVIIGSNAYYSFVKNSSGGDFAKRLEAAKYIVKEAGGKEYNLKGRGDASQFESFTMNYEYLTWWMGNGPTKVERPLKFIISEETGIKVRKEMKSKK